MQQCHFSISYRAFIVEQCNSCKAISQRLNATFYYFSLLDHKLRLGLGVVPTACLRPKQSLGFKYYCR